MAQRMSSRKSSRLVALLVSSLVLVALSAGLVPVHEHEYHAARSCTLCSTGTPPATPPSTPQRTQNTLRSAAFLGVENTALASPNLSRLVSPRAPPA